MYPQLGLPLNHCHLRLTDRPSYKLCYTSWFDVNQHVYTEGDWVIKKQSMKLVFKYLFVYPFKKFNIPRPYCCWMLFLFEERVWTGYVSLFNRLVYQTTPLNPATAFVGMFFYFSLQAITNIENFHFNTFKLDDKSVETNLTHRHLMTSLFSTF